VARVPEHPSSGQRQTLELRQHACCGNTPAAAHTMAGVFKHRLGELTVHEFAPAGTALATVLTVHPWAVLGGGEHNCLGVARELAAAGLRALTFEMRSSSATWGVLSAHRSEIAQVASVGVWASERWEAPLVLFGSSAGAPIAGSALPALPQAVAYIAVGYTFGWFATLGFGRHFGSLLRSQVPKFFLMGEKDEFTSQAVLQRTVGKASGEKNDVLIVPGVGHFELEQSTHDSLVAAEALKWLLSVLPHRTCATSSAAAAAGSSTEAPPSRSSAAEAGA